MKKLKLTAVFVLLTFAGSLTSPSCSNKKVVKLDTTPEQVLEKMLNKPEIQGTYTGEGFCWQARVGMDQYVNNYELTEDTEWLDAGIKYYDYLISRMITDPDGYKCWMGPYGYDENYWQDALVGDAILYAGMLDFSVLVLENEKLKSKYSGKANLYVEMAKKDFVEKWDKRGCWIQDGPYGSYIGFNKYLKADNLDKWILAPEVSRSGVSHPFNKQEDAAEVCLLLNRITGEQFYWDRAESIFFTAKSHFQYFDDHYCWNYYDPLYPGDIDMERKETRHGVWVHPWRSGYQAGEVGKIVMAYHYGMVFDSTDIQRIINTNLNVMWNKDMENPKFISSNGLGADGDTSGLAAFQRTYGHSNATKNAGQLWTSLMDFNQTIRDINAAQLKKSDNPVRYERFMERMKENPPSFKRKYAKVVKVKDVNFTECKDLYLAVVLPHIIPKNGESIIVCKSWNPGELQIDLYSSANEKLGNLYTGNIEKDRTFLITWDGKDPKKKAKYVGEYKIRWTINNGYREFPVVIN